LFVVIIKGSLTVNKTFKVNPGNKNPAAQPS